jgi:molybdopterin-containing oxidoreductase family iron-sulfur binding subunit
MWCSWVEINEKKAHELGIQQGDVIEVTSTQGSVRAPAFLNPGIAPDAVAMPVGQGHTISRATRAIAASIRCRFSRRPRLPRPARWRGRRRA